jgi:hypothetical protein
MSRLEILKWVEDHPSELASTLEHRADEVIRDLERWEREARRALKRPVPREVYEDVPF